MMRASLGSATRHIDLKMMMTATSVASTTMPMMMNGFNGLPLGSGQIGETTMVRGGEYSTTRTRLPVVMVSPRSSA